MNYHEEQTMKNNLLLREKLKELPSFLRDFFRGIEAHTAARTRLAYAHDLKVFFMFLHKEVAEFMDKPIESFTLLELSHITISHMEDFMDYLSYYIKTNEEKQVEMQNQERGKSRKLYAVRSMFSYFYKKRQISANPAEPIDSPKLHEKAKVFLEVDEVAKLLDEVESGEKLTQQQKRFHCLTQKRDLAIVTLLLGTGIRISECVGLDINHFSFDNGSFKVTRKGGDEVVLYFGNEVEQAILAYLEQRETIGAVLGHENALFLSLQRKRLTDRAIQNLVKKYAKLIATLKNISPHKLRSTFGTTLYRETGDIYLVADVLGHKDVNTTRKHYAATHEEQGRRAVRQIHLREE